VAPKSNKNTKTKNPPEHHPMRKTQYKILPEKVGGRVPSVSESNSIDSNLNLGPYSLMYGCAVSEMILQMA